MSDHVIQFEDVSLCLFTVRNFMIRNCVDKCKGVLYCIHNHKTYDEFEELNLRNENIKLLTIICTSSVSDTY